MTNTTENVSKAPTYRGKTKAQIVYEWLKELRDPNNKQCKAVLKDKLGPDVV